MVRNFAKQVLPFLINSKDLEPSYKMDLDFQDCFGTKKFRPYNQRNKVNAFTVLVAMLGLDQTAAGSRGSGLLFVTKYQTSDRANTCKPIKILRWTHTCHSADKYLNMINTVRTRLSVLYVIFLSLNKNAH